jgi:hypothetical protein
MEKNKNIFPLIVIFVVVAALIGGAYWFGKNSMQNSAFVDVREVSDDETGEGKEDASGEKGLAEESSASAGEFSASSSSSAAADSSSTSAPSVPEESDESVIETLKLLFAQKYEKRIDDIFVTISKREGDYLVGSVKFAGEDAGAHVLAAKVNGSWKIIFDGNGMWTCDIVDVVDFPSTLVPECLDENTMEVVNR